MKELIEAYDKYIAMLTRAEATLLPLARAHGFKFSDKAIAEGRELRAKIVELKTALSSK